jgi:ribosomal-protein-alanine N-acetyltransferase
MESGAAAGRVEPGRLRTMMQVRLAANRDLPRILEIEKLCFAQPWSLESFKRELLLPFSRILVAIDDAPGGDNRPAGFLCRWLVADECHILNIGVHPDSRRSGVATRLMQHTIDEAKAKRSLFVTLEVRRTNLQARRLYRKLNFEEHRLRRNYYGPGEDAIVMELILGAVR